MIQNRYRYKIVRRYFGFKYTTTNNLAEEIFHVTSFIVAVEKLNFVYVYAKRGPRW